MGVLTAGWPRLGFTWKRPVNKPKNFCLGHRRKPPPRLHLAESTPEWLTTEKNPLCSLVLRVLLKDDFCLPLVCSDIRLSHDLCYTQVVLNGSWSRGAGRDGQNLLVLLVSEVWLRVSCITDAEKRELKRLNATWGHQELIFATGHLQHN